jgi:hypothetical protein
MSFFRKLVGVAAPIVGGIVGGPVGMALGGALGAAVQKTPAQISTQAAQVSSLTASMAPASMGALPQVFGRTLPMIGAAGGAIVAGARTVARSANVYCRRHPAWCASIGGLPGVVGLLESGQLPPIRRRRGRGLTPKDLRSFRRVANTIKVFCPTVRRVPSRALRGHRTQLTHS